MERDEEDIKHEEARLKTEAKALKRKKGLEGGGVGEDKLGEKTVESVGR